MKPEVQPSIVPGLSASINYKNILKKGKYDEYFCNTVLYIRNTLIIGS
jgi:hypothetical protein